MLEQWDLLQSLAPSDALTVTSEPQASLQFTTCGSSQDLSFIACTGAAPPAVRSFAARALILMQYRRPCLFLLFSFALNGVCHGPPGGDHAVLALWFTPMLDAPDSVSLL